MHLQQTTRCLYISVVLLGGLFIQSSAQAQTEVKEPPANLKERFSGNGDTNIREIPTSLTPLKLDEAVPNPANEASGASGAEENKVEGDSQTTLGQGSSLITAAPGGDEEQSLEKRLSPDSGIASPRALLRALWQDAVSTGRTEVGFNKWLAQQLSGVDEDDGASSEDVTAKREGEDTQSNRIRNASQKWDKRTGPVAQGSNGRVVTTFGEAIPVAYCSPLTICYIELEPGEVLTDSPSWGDAVRWQVAAKTQGRDPQTVVLEVKPSGDATHTNLVIPTDRRLYTISLVMDKEVHTPILTFHWPDSEAARFEKRIAERKKKEADAKRAASAAKRKKQQARQARLAKVGVPTKSGLKDAGKLDFNFRIEGAARFRPTRVYTDGRRTYIDLHPNYHGALPVIIAGKGESNRVLNTHVQRNGRRLVADRVVSDIYLQSGNQKVRIRRAGR